MNSFFVLNETSSLHIPDDFIGSVIFYAKSKNEQIASSQFILIQRLVENGLNLKLSQFILIDINSSKYRISSLRKKIPLKNCILFGVKESEIGLNVSLPTYQNRLITDIIFLKSYVPEDIENKATLKKALWEQLQLIFKI